MKPWSERSLAAVRALAEGVVALPPDGTTRSLLAGLERARGLLERPTPAAPSTLTPILAGARHAVLQLAADSETRTALLAHLSEAQNAAFAGAAPPYGALSSGPPLEKPPRASRERPRAHAPARPAFVWAGPGADDSNTASASLSPVVAAEPDPPEEEPSALLDPDAPDAPPALAPPAAPAAPAEKGAVWIDGEGFSPWPADRFYQRLADGCLETIAAVHKGRSRLPLSERAGSEQRLLAQVDAVLATPGDVVGRVLASFRAGLEIAGPSRRWTTALVLASLEGDDALLAVLAALFELPAGAVEDGLAMAAALDVSPHPTIDRFGRVAVAAEHPLARAAGIEVLSRRMALAADELRPLLLDASPAVAAAAARAVARLDATGAAPLLPLLRSALRFPHPAVAREAARALLLHGDAHPYEEVRTSGPGAEHLDLYAAEILVLRGDAHDLDLLQKLLARRPTTPAHLALVARFGHPGSWAYLVHHLQNEDLADSAAAALTRLFGPLVDPGDEESPAAWRSALRAKKPAPDVRLFAGEPWRPRAIAAALGPGSLAQHDAETLLDELAVRARLPAPPDLDRWSADVLPDLQRIAQDLAARDARYRTGGWAVAT